MSLNVCERYVTAVFVTCLMAVAVDLWPSSTRPIRVVEKWSPIYNLDFDEALAKYRALVGPDPHAAFLAANYFKSHNAFEIGAAALPEVKERRVTRFIVVEILQRKRDFSQSTCDAALRTLERANRERPSNDVDHNAGVENLKASLAIAIGHWLRIEDLPSRRGDTRPAYERFITVARRKANETMTSSPF